MKPKAAPAREAIYRHRLPVRLTHWLNALFLLVLLMSGLQIFNAHPRLYWGAYGANADPAFLEIGARGEEGFARLGALEATTTGMLGRSANAQGQTVLQGFPSWSTIPSWRDLAAGRRWHFFFAWLFVLNGLAYLAWGLASGHFRRDLAPTRRELRPRHLAVDVWRHLRLRFHKGEEAKRYNTQQKLTYCGVIFALLPLAVLTGLTMSPGFNAVAPWLLDLFGGRQSARSLHFITAVALVLFVLVHVVMVVLAGPVNEMRSMITGWFVVPSDDRRPDAASVEEVQR